MRNQLLEVISLQKEYSAKNTAAMQRRGQLIRNEIRDELRTNSAQLKSALGFHGDDFDVQGRDGTGQKTIIPWVRFFSKSRSPSAQNGWYCVYLFDAPGTGVYLELGHGSTTLIDGDYRPRPDQELIKLVTWGRGILAPIIENNPDLLKPMELKAQGLGNAYERSSVLTKWYPANAIPSDETLLKDAVEFAGYLKVIYDAETLGLSPTAPPPEVSEVEITVAGNPTRKSRGQGFGLTPLERRAVELHAMGKAKDHLRSLGWQVRDVSSNRPYDFLCKKDGDEIIVEVKGTTSNGEQVIITTNEVSAHRARHPKNALIIIHSINLSRPSDGPKADGGTLRWIHPWEVRDEQMRPLAFQYTV